MSPVNDTIEKKKGFHNITIVSFSRKTIEKRISEILSVDRSSFQPPYDMWDLDNFLYKLPNKNELSFLLLDKKINKIIGFLIGSSYSDSTHINRIALAPEYRSKGLGVILTDKFISKSKSLGFKKTTLSTLYDKEHDYVIKFYEKQGYKLLTEKNTIIEFLKKNDKPQDFELFYPPKSEEKLLVMEKKL